VSLVEYAIPSIVTHALFSQTYILGLNLRFFLFPPQPCLLHLYRLKYSMSIVADRGLKKSQYTSARLKKGDVLYMETHRHRYVECYFFAI
jgi:hypothetical protein